jgi:CBS domain-containing protein
MHGTRVVMTTDIKAVGMQTPIYDAVEILLGSDITGLPVIDDDMTLLGIITEKDVLTLLSQDEDDSATVEKYMTRDVVSFDDKTDLIEICECLIESDFRRVPITSHGRLAGIVSRRDIIKYILEPIG